MKRHRLPAPTRCQRALQALTRALLLAALSSAAFTPAAAWASDKNDHERARQAVQAGEVLPLPALLYRLQRTHPGKVLELELERDDRRWIYEVKLLQAQGQLIKLKLDASTGQVLQARRKGERERDQSRKPEPPAKSSVAMTANRRPAPA